MTGVKNFDLLNSSLEGTNLIEASAGTGKTYIITGLFLRLVLEKNLSVNEILVVTFTEAATEELRERIRSKLQDAVRIFSGGECEDAFLNDLVKRLKGSRSAIKSLKEALRAFDQAAIFTIHGFCRRMLYENAFESGSLFDTELVTDQEDLKRDIVDDFWRKNLYNASPLFVKYAISSKFSTENLSVLLSNNTARQYLKIIPQVEIPDSSQQEDEFKRSIKEVCKAWPSAREEVEKILTFHEGLNRVKYGNVKIPAWIQSMDLYVSSGAHPILFKGFEKFTSSEIEHSMKKDHAPPAHPFFELCENHIKRSEELKRVFEMRLLGLKTLLFHYAEDELTHRKRERNIQSFDDLLLKLYKALEAKGGEYLAGAMRAEFKAALIDEFQDTDPIQYAIFRKVFGTGSSILFLIGDPKQAIYGFRGADIFAYMKAKGDVISRYTLSANWRADPDLITAINAIFSKAEHPFVYNEIPFQPAVPATREVPEILMMDGQSEPPLHLWFIDAGKITEQGKTITRAQALEIIPRAVAAKISCLLSRGRNNKTMLGKRRLREGDIAVLVRTNREALLMKEALLSLHIPSVLYSTGNLFDSHEALEMERVLAGIAEPDNDSSFRVALTTDMLGVRGEELDDLMEDEAGLENWLVKFKEYHDLWAERGFIRMFRYLFLKERVLIRLMTLPDGERRNTNLLHLSEVLHQISIEKKLGMSGLLKWFSEQRDPKTPRVEEHQLRLESDENAVKLVTIHKSKGLEYPVVFCPFTWEGSRIKRSMNPFTFHDERENMRLTLDLGSPDLEKNRLIAENERLAENVRLLYVALTRAKNRCYIVWGRFNGAETSAPAYLFHPPESLEQGNVVGAIGKRFKGLPDKDVFKELQTIQDKAGSAINLSEMPMGPAEEYSLLPAENVLLSCRKFSGNIDREWRISSFSSITSGRPHRAELADRDSISLQDTYHQKETEEDLAGEEPPGIFSFPKGAKAGTFFHDIFEHLDFAQKDSSLMKKLVVEKLKEYGYETVWLDTISDMIAKVLSAPLGAESEGLTLSRIESQDRLNELEFYFPLKKIAPEKLTRIFRKNLAAHQVEDIPETMGKLQFSPTRGYMKGFMDMVFQWNSRYYLVDWKSNFLGGRIEDYSRETLNAVMKDEFYILQYHIYTVALNQYLRMRLPGYRYENHFGGVFYIFLRGVDPEIDPDFGIYSDLPSPELIKALREELIQTQ